MRYDKDMLSENRLLNSVDIVPKGLHRIAATKAKVSGLMITVVPLLILMILQTGRSSSESVTDVGARLSESCPLASASFPTVFWGRRNMKEVLEGRPSSFASSCFRSCLSQCIRG